MKSVNQNGRSMVEMLGVLAVVGMLSVGGLAGYSKAMARHKLNKTIDAFEDVLQVLIDAEESDSEKDLYVADADDIIDYGILPECKKTQGVAGVGDYGCQLPIGVFEMEYIFDNSKNYSKGSLVVSFRDVQSCIAFASSGVEKNIPRKWFKSTGNSNSGGVSINGNVIYKPEGSHPVNQVNISRVSSLCNQYCKNKPCYWHFDKYSPVRTFEY